MSVKYLSTHKKCNYGENVRKKSTLKVPGGLKSQQTLTAWPFSLLLSI